MELTELVIQTGYGAGATFTYRVSVIPRIGDEIWLDQVPTIYLTVCRVIHQPQRDRVIVQCPQHINDPNEIPGGQRKTEQQ
jgi:hypothetical protein